jgi:uncharacterized membrane protein YesL
MTKHSPGVWSEENVETLPEPTFLRKIVGDLWESLFTLVVWGLLMLLLGLAAIWVSLVFPLLGLIMAVFTVAPALAGLMVAYGKGARGSFVRLGDAVRGTFHLYWRSVALALPLMILVGLVSLTYTFLAANPNYQELAIAGALQIGVALTFVILFIYLYPVLALYDLSLKDTLILSAALAIRNIWQTVLLLIFGVALLALMLLTEGNPIFWIFLPGPWCVVVMNATYRMARRLVPDQSAIDK